MQYCQGPRRPSNYCRDDSLQWSNVLEEDLIQFSLSKLNSDHPLFDAEKTVAHVDNCKTLKVHYQFKTFFFKRTWKKTKLAVILYNNYKKREKKVQHNKIDQENLDGVYLQLDKSIMIMLLLHLKERKQSKNLVAGKKSQSQQKHYWVKIYHAFIYHDQVKKITIIFSRLMIWCKTL